jgi:hypothetical protein
LYTVVGTGLVVVEICGMVNDSAGAGVTLSGRYSQDSTAPLAGEIVNIGNPFPVSQRFLSADASGYYGFCTRLHTTLAVGTWWFDLAIFASSGATTTARVRDVYLTLIEY